VRLKSIILCSTSFAMFGLCAAPAAAQGQTTTTADEGMEAQEAPADAEASPEVADSTTDASGDEIVVTGIRRSLQSAQNIRRNSEQIVDSVVAEDIGKLPDLNTAQTAARIPGVQVYRQGGEAQNVLVRGLPNFTTTYNGREIFTAERRDVALQDFPSSNIAALEVFKTSTANLVEPGLAGLINVRSRQPFDFREGQVAGSVWALHTLQGDATTPNFNFLATNRWELANGAEIGLLINASRTEMRYLDAEISNTDFAQTFRAVGVNGLVADPAAGTAARFPDIQRLFYRSGERVRPSVNAALQIRPTRGFEVYAEGLWQGFRNKIDDRLLAAELHGGPDVLQYTNRQFRDGTNILTSGTVTARPDSLFSFQGGTYNKTDTYQFAVGTRVTGDRLKGSFDIARTQSTFTGSTESVDRRFIGAPTINFDNSEPEFLVTNINLRDPSKQFFTGLFEEGQESKGDDWQFRGDLEYEFDSAFLKSFEIGARYTVRDATRRYSNRFGGANGPNGTALPVELKVFKGVDFGGTTDFASPTYKSIRRNVGALRQLAGLPLAPLTGALLYTADEKTMAGYGQLNVGTDNIDGIVGVRVSRVDTRVSGPQLTGIEEIDEGSERTVILPNASVRARLSQLLQVRAAVSKTRTLPSFGDLNPALSLGPPTTNPGGIGTPSNPRGGSGGNPFLRPFTAWNYDAAAEFYLGRTAFAAITGFHRSIEGFIQQSTFDIEDPVLGTLRISGPVNTGKGRITGVELQGQAFADYEWLPEWARGFGVQANLTYIDAKTQQPSGPGSAPLTFQPITDQLNGVSKWNYNLVGIYERYGLAARLTYNGRSSYRATQQFRRGGGAGEFNDDYREFAHPADRLDLSLNYDLSEQFTFFGDWTNITRSTFRQDFTTARNGAPEAEFIRYRRYDESTLSFGLRFRFGG
jgi:TonB-dependent receptor